MSDIRLDPATLRFVIDLMAGSEFCGRRVFAYDLKPFLDKAESRPATFSDFVRACEVSDLGMPEFRGSFQAHWGSIASGWWARVEFPTADGFDEPLISVRGREYRGDLSTPAALTAALNALAKERTP